MKEEKFTMATRMDDYHFCSGQLRPEFCIVETNACCLNCEHNNRCQQLASDHNARVKSPKLVPCTSANCGPDDVCEFAC